MSMNIHVVPVPHATKRTTIIKRLSDNKLQTRVEDPVGTVADKFFDFATDGTNTSSYSEGDSKQFITVADNSATNDDPVLSIWVDKKGTDAFAYVEVIQYYDSSLTGENAPQERDLWYAYNTDNKDIPDFDSSFVQSDPLYFLWLSGGTPESPTVAFPTSPTNSDSQNTKLASIYSQLAVTDSTLSQDDRNTLTLQNRRTYLKQLIRQNTIDHPNYPQWLAGNFLPALTSNTGSDIKEYLQNLQTLSYYPEMLTRAISLDGNLTGSESERKFNLLEGMAKLDLGVVHRENLTRSLASKVTSRDGSGSDDERITDRNSWVFMILGTIAAGNSGAYTAPTTDWSLTADVTDSQAGTTELIDLNGSVAVIGSDHDWQSWLREE